MCADSQHRTFFHVSRVLYVGLGLHAGLAVLSHFACISAASLELLFQEEGVQGSLTSVLLFLLRSTSRPDLTAAVLKTVAAVSKKLDDARIYVCLAWLAMLYVYILYFTYTHIHTVHTHKGFVSSCVGVRLRRTAGHRGRVHIPSHCVRFLRRSG